MANLDTAIANATLLNFRKCVSLLVIGGMLTSMIQPAIAAEQIKRTGTLPPQIAQWLPKKQSSLIASTTTPAAVAPTSLARVEETLRNTVPEVFTGAQSHKAALSAPSNTALASDEALKRAADAIVGQLDAIDAETQTTRQQFAIDREQLKSAAKSSNKTDSDAILVKRHTDTVTEFEARAAEFKRLAQAVKAAQAGPASTQPARTADIKVAFQALAGFMVKYPNQRVHQAVDPIEELGAEELADLVRRVVGGIRGRKAG